MLLVKLYSVVKAMEMNKLFRGIRELKEDEIVAQTWMMSNEWIIKWLSTPLPSTSFGPPRWALSNKVPIKCSSSPQSTFVYILLIPMPLYTNVHCISTYAYWNRHVAGGLHRSSKQKCTAYSYKIDSWTRGQLIAAGVFPTSSTTSWGPLQRYLDGCT